MSTVVIGDGCTEVRCGNDLFMLYEGDEGGLYIEAANCCPLKVSVSDDDDPQVDVRGTWVNISIAVEEEEN